MVERRTGLLAAEHASGAQDGGWGQDGGETSYVRNGENLESSGNDLANTAVAALAFLEGGSTPTHGRNGFSTPRLP